MNEVKPNNKNPQIGVRFEPAEMERVRDHADRNYAGVVSTMVKVAVRRLMEAEQAREQAETMEAAA